MANETLQIEIVYANEFSQQLKTLNVPQHSTIEAAIKASNFLTEFPEINLAENSVGIFSKKAKLSTQLNPGDRIEIYRPLQIDPKQARRLRAQKSNKV